MIKNAIRTLFTAQFLKFLAVGGVAAGLQWASRFAFSHYMPFAAAVLAAYLIGLSSGYFLNVVFVFRNSGRNRKVEMAYYTMFNLAALPVVWGISVLLGSIVLPRVMSLSTAQALGNGLGIISPVAINFLLHKHLTFRTPTETSLPKGR